MQKTFITEFEQVIREINVIAWVFESQFSEPSKDISTIPIIHSKGRLLAKYFSVKSNVELLQLQQYFKHFTERYENSNNNKLLFNELLEISKRAKEVLNFYNDNLTSECEIVKKYFSNAPNQFEEMVKYSKFHSGFIVVNDFVQVEDIVFNSEYWQKSYKYNYLTSNYELALFLQKLIDFVNRFSFDIKEVSESGEFENLKRLCEISLEYSKDKNCSIKDLPIEFETVARIDLFSENLTKAFQSLIDEGKDTKTVLSLIDVLIQRKQTDIKNPLLIDKKNINEYFEEKLKSIKLLFSSIPQQSSLNAQTENPPQPKTTIQPEAFEAVYSILKDFFDVEYQNEFKTILETFGTAKNKLTFKGNGNQFADTFKKLFENSFITGCLKTDLINWIVSNYRFLNRNTVTDFKAKTVEQIISGKQTPCKNPIIEVKTGKILKIDY